LYKLRSLTPESDFFKTTPQLIIKPRKIPSRILPNGVHQLKSGCAFNTLTYTHLMFFIFPRLNICSIVIPIRPTSSFVSPHPALFNMRLTSDKFCTAITFGSAEFFPSSSYSPSYPKMSSPYDKPLARSSKSWFSLILNLES